MLLNGNADHCQSVQDSLNFNNEINNSDWVIHTKITMFTQTKKTSSSNRELDEGGLEKQNEKDLSISS